MSTLVGMSRLLDRAEIDRQLADLPRWHCFDRSLRVRYTTATFPAAIALVSAVADVAEEVDHHPDLALHWTRLDLSLWTHVRGGVTQLDVELAHRVARLAADHDARAGDPPLRRVEIGIDCVDATALLPFWRAGLGLRETVAPEQDDGTPELRDPDGVVPTVWFQPMHPPRRARSRTHVDVYVPAAEAATRTEAVLAAGGTLLSDEHAPQWWVTADPEGNELCVCAEGDQ